MWTPTHVKVTVHRARNLQVKCRSGVNDSYVVICLDDEKFTTSVKTRNKNPGWNESYDMSLPSDLKYSLLRLTVHHRNLFGFDDLLGETNIPLSQLNIYERPQSRWYSLSNKRGSKKSDDDSDGDRNKGEIQVTVTFMVRSRMTSSDSSNGKLDRQRSLSFRSLVNLVGMKLSRQSSHSDLRESRLADLTERKFPLHSVVDIHDVSRSFHHIRLSSSDDDVFNRHQTTTTTTTTKSQSPKIADEADTRVIFSISSSDSDGNLRRKEKDQEQEVDGQSTTPVAMETVRRRPGRQRSLQTLMEESHEWKTKETPSESINNAKNLLSNSSVPVYADDYLSPLKRHSYIGCGEAPPMVAAFQLNEINDFVLNKQQASDPPKSENVLEIKDSEGLDNYNRDELIRLVLEQQSWMQSKHQYVQDLENYIDGLLIRVLETSHQSILENPYIKPNNKSKKSTKSVEKTMKKRLIDLIKIWKD